MGWILLGAVLLRKVIMSRVPGTVMRTKAVLLALLMATFSLSGCFGEDEVIVEPEPIAVEEPRIFVTDKTGASLDVSPLEMIFQFSDVGETGKEPSIGITSSGCISLLPWRKLCALATVGKAGKKPKTQYNARQQPAIRMGGLIRLPTASLAFR